MEEPSNAIPLGNVSELRVTDRETSENSAH